VPQEGAVRASIGYLTVFVVLLTAGLIANVLGSFPQLDPIRIPLSCGLVGGIGGCVYCLRGVYLNACVHKRWDPDWLPWYYIRPIVSVACGAVSFLFLHAGLLILESTRRPDSTNLGFYALAFIAGLNVDKFMVRIEDLAHAAWGIEKSRVAANSSADR
jgi:hypothetical protein